MNAEELFMLHLFFLISIIFAILNTVGKSIPIMGLKFLMSGQNRPYFLSKESAAVSLVKETF